MDGYRTRDKICQSGGFPAGSVLARDDKIIAEAARIGALINDPVSHSDIAVIRRASVREAKAGVSGARFPLRPCRLV